MRRSSWIWICVISTTAGIAAQTQSPAPCTTPVALGALSLTLPMVGAPYTATIETTKDQTLPDGATVHGTVITYQARDSAGREWQKRSLGCQPGPDGVRRPVMQTIVYDPGTGTTLSWREDDPARIIHVVHSRPRTPQPPLPEDPQKDAAAVRAMEKLMGMRAEDLGTRIIAGVLATGMRTTQTVPVQKGIDQPIQIIQETWTAKALDLEVLNIDDNSRNGRTVMKVVELKQGDPDPALFAAPAGYTIQEPKPAQ